jgi:Ca2+-binding RTX toxin-like protein
VVEPTPTWRIRPHTAFPEINALNGDDTVDASGVPAGVILLTEDGGNGDDVLIGGRGDDVLIGGPGQDALDGGPGHNILIQD